jgi:hypothetical protein
VSSPAVIAMPSIMSLHVTSVDARGNDLVQGTAFVVRYAAANWLFTNWHVAAGRRPNDGQPMHPAGSTPVMLRVWHNAPTMGNWRAVEYELLHLGTGQPKWLEHPVHRRRVDAVGVTIPDQPGLTFYPYTVGGPGDELSADVAEDVSIIGFPFGLRAGGSVAVWSRGAVASEPQMDFDSRPCFLIDSRTRQGQSGSPVVVYSSGNGGHRMQGGSLVVGGGPLVRLLGIYSGRLNAESDLGFVWKTQALVDIMAAGVAGNGDMTDPEAPQASPV